MVTVRTRWCIAVVPLVIASLILAPPLRTTACASAESLIATLPGNLLVPDSLKPVLEDVMRRSPTFRHQLQELRHSRHVKMAIVYGNLSTWHLLRAESLVSRYQWGALDVETRLYTVDDVVEVIAHEMEHVCEQIEGVDVRALACQRHSGVYRIGPHFETQRAILVGKQVAREAMGVRLGAVRAHFAD